MKKIMFYILAILLVVTIGVSNYFAFPIKSDTSNLEAKINDLANRGYSTSYLNNINLYDSIIIGDLRYTPIKLDDQLGYVSLKKGFMGRYKIDHLAYGGGNFRNGVVEKGGQKFLILIGQNTFGEISKVKFTVDSNYNYHIDTSTQEVFINFTEVDKNTEIGPISLDKIKVYDAEGNDITSVINLSGSSIQ